MAEAPVNDLAHIKCPEVTDQVKLKGLATSSDTCIKK